MSLYYNDAYNEMKEQARWVLLLCGNYAYNNLIDKYQKNGNTNLSYNLHSYCSDRRRTPTIRKHLNSLNLIKLEHFQNETIEPIPEEIEKLLAGFSKEPKVEASGIKMKREHLYSSIESPVVLKETGEAYLNIDDMNAYEIIYIYLHQEDYNFVEFKHTFTYRNSKNYLGMKSHDTYTIKIFPKKLTKTLDEEIIKENIREYAKGHGREILSATFKLNLRELNDKKPYFSIQSLQVRYKEVSAKITQLERVKTELEAILMDLNGMDEEDYYNKLYEASKTYINEQAPLWIFDDEDKEKQQIAKLILKGTELITETRGTR